MSEWPQIEVYPKELRSLKEIPEGGPCPCCDSPTMKVFLKQYFPSTLDEKSKLIVWVHEVPGFRCSAEACAWERTSNQGVIDAIVAVIPVFRERGFDKTVAKLEWTKEHFSRVIAQEGQPQSDYLWENPENKGT